MNLRFVVLTAAFLVTTVATVHCQEIRLSDWQTLSSLYTVTSMDVDDSGTCWAATTGGVVAYTPGSSNVREYRNVGALQSLDCSAIFCDRRRGDVYVGQRNGAIDVVRKDGSWQNIRDILRATQYPRRSILSFAQRGDTLLIATEFGVVLWDARREVFIATIDRVGTLEENTPVRSIALHADSIWLATSKGLAVAPLNVQTLRLPSVWTIRTRAEGLDSDDILHCQSNASELVVTTKRGLFRWNGGGFERLLETIDDINGLANNGGTWEVSTPTTLLSTAGTNRPDAPGPIRSMISATFNGRQQRVLAIDAHGFGIVSDDNTVALAPIECPSSNQFADMSIDVDGNLWVATDDNPGRGFGGQGVSWYDGQRWRTVTTSNQPLLKSNNCYRVASVSDGSTWIGTWGFGAIRCTPADTGLRVEAYSFQNSSLAGVSGDSTYVLVAGAEIDRYGRTWLLNEQAANQLLAVRDNQSWIRKPNCTNARENVVRHMSIDLQGTVWLGGHQGLGLIAYNDRNTPSDADDLCNKLTTSNSQLPDNAITALAVDLTGALWIGTAKGLAVMSAPGALTNSSVPYVRRVSALTSATVVSDIHVDALNYKWVATTSGVFVLDPSGTEVVSTITAGSSPLLSDNVRCVTVDERNGLAYFGTIGGCSVARTSSMRPLSTFNLMCYPQPFSPTRDQLCVIDGLAPDSDIKIMTISGTMVAGLQVRGRQAIWNGTDTFGNHVPPGIYIVNASSASAGTAAVTKIAVER